MLATAVGEESLEDDPSGAGASDAMGAALAAAVEEEALEDDPQAPRARTVSARALVKAMARFEVEIMGEA